MRVHSARLLIGLGLLAGGRVAVADWHVWTVTETRHVLRSESPGSGLAVSVAAARNEWVSFQILVRAAEPVPGVRVEAGALRGPDGAVLPTSESRLYREHQLHLEIGTYRNEAFRPDWYPDPLIPVRSVPVRALNQTPDGVTTNLRAMPFDLPANETHGFWVDLYVPAQTPSGEYRGVYRVTGAGGKSQDVPVVLTVWKFTLPPTPTLVTAFGTPRLRDYYRQRAQANQEPGPSDWRALETQCAQLLSEHRCNATPPAELLRPVAQSDGSFQIPSERVQALRQFVDCYHVNALELPHPSSVIKDPVAQGDKLRAWLAAFDKMAKELNRPQIVFYVYLKDEPNTRQDYEYVQKWGRAIRAAKSVVQVMVVEQTWTEPGLGGADSAWGDLYGAVDIWCPLFSLQRQESAAQRQALGETVWAYTALCQGRPTPWWHIDFPLLNYRVPAWMAWRDRMKGLLYWGGMSYWRETDDPWVHAPVYTGKGVFQQGDNGIRYNGEGSLVYPARAVGFDGIVPTIRLKALRDAIEDYEYLAILDRLGKAAETDKIVRRLTESWFQWDKDPAAYEKARAALAELIVAATKANSPSAPKSAMRSPVDAPAEKPAPGLSVTAERPNIVFLLADDLGWADLGCYGVQDIRTPRIDRLAREGVRFTQFYANGPECSPTRAAFLTGRYQQRVGGLECAIGAGNVGRYDDAIRLAAQHDLGLPVSEVTISRLLKDAGYATALIGKWHLGYEDKFAPGGHGFDHAFYCLSGGMEYFHHVDEPPTCGPVLRFDGAPIQRRGYFTDLVADDAVRWLGEHAKHPFFLYVPFTAPHAPYQGPADGLPAPLPADSVRWKQGKADPKVYAAMIERLDYAVGRILDRLQELGVADHTLVIFASDNGGTASARPSGLRGIKGMTFEGGIRVPCLARWPGVLPAGAEFVPPTVTFDLTASMARVAGVAPAQGRPFDGIDILHYAETGSVPPPRALFWRGRRGENTWRAVRDGAVKYVSHRKGDHLDEWLFDVERDLGEKNDLRAARPADVTRLKKELAAWEIEVRPAR